MLSSLSSRRWKALLVLPAAVLAFTTASCQIEREQAGELPDIDVDVDADPGQLPEYDVEGPEVTVGTEEETITVPEVEITQEEKTITTPDIDVELPGEDAE